MRSLVLALVMAFLPLVPAQAQNYVGLSWGLMSYDDGAESLDSQGFTLVAGGQFDPLMAAEFSYTSLANVEINSQDNNASLMALSLVVRSPGEGFEPFLRIGLARGDASFMGTQQYSKEKDGLIYGLGADFSLNYNSSLRFEFVEADIDGADTNRLSFGTLYRF
jgi:opacity protein-like surface antigen